MAWFLNGLRDAVIELDLFRSRAPSSQASSTRNAPTSSTEPIRASNAQQHQDQYRPPSSDDVRHIIIYIPGPLSR